MNEEEPKKIYHFYCGHTSEGSFFFQSWGESEKILCFGYSCCGDLATAREGSHTIPNPQIAKNIPKLGKVSKIAKGNKHTLFLMSPKEDVYGVGNSEYGEFSVKQEEVLSPILVTSESLKGVKIGDIACGGDFSVLLSKNGVPYSCGHNEEGQCGVGTFKKAIYSAILMKIKEKIIQIDCGEKFTVLLTNKRDIYKTGSILSERKVNIPIKLKLNEKVKFFRAGIYHLLVVGNSGKLYGLGSNRSGQLSIQRDSKNVFNEISEINLPLSGNGTIRDIKCGCFCSYILMKSGDLYGFGYNSYGQSSGNIENNSSNTLNLIKQNVEQVEVGFMTCFVFCKGEVYVVGFNEHGNLGLGNCNDIPKLTLNKSICNVKKIMYKKVFHVNNIIEKSKMISVDCKLFSFEKDFMINFSSTQSITIPSVYAIQSKKIQKIIKEQKKFAMKVEESKYSAISNMKEFMLGNNVTISSNEELVESYVVSKDFNIIGMLVHLINFVDSMKIEDVIECLFILSSKDLESSSIFSKCLKYVKTNHEKVVFSDNDLFENISEWIKIYNCNHLLGTILRLKDENQNDLPKLEENYELVDVKDQLDFTIKDFHSQHLSFLIVDDLTKDLCFRSFDGKYIKCHKDIITKEGYFERMLTRDEFEESNKDLPFVQLNIEAMYFISIMIYIYIGEVQVQDYNLDDLIMLSLLCDKFLMDKMKEKVDGHILNHEVVEGKKFMDLSKRNGSLRLENVDSQFENIKLREVVKKKDDEISELKREIEELKSALRKKRNREELKYDETEEEEELEGKKTKKRKKKK